MTTRRICSARQGRLVDKVDSSTRYKDSSWGTVGISFSIDVPSSSDAEDGEVGLHCSAATVFR